MDNIEKFGEIFINEVRDSTINCFENIFSGTMKGITAQIIQEKILQFNDEEKKKILWIISKAIDQCMYNVLFMAEEHDEIEIMYEGENIVEESDGLTGELYTEDGWIEKYSEKP